MWKIIKLLHDSRIKDIKDKWRQMGLGGGRKETASCDGEGTEWRSVQAEDASGRAHLACSAACRSFGAAEIPLARLCVGVKP